MTSSNKEYDVVVIGGGPAGLAAALSANEFGSKSLIIEREDKLGGILKQCIHDGFGLIRFNEKLSGPEYAGRYIDMIKEKNIPVYINTFVNSIEKEDNIFNITLVNSQNGIFKIYCKSIVLANGCRERTSKQVFIQGDRPSGVYTAGTAQYLTNILGYLPCEKCVILGSGDIGLIMARRLTLEGAKVLGVYEVKSEPSGLNRNIAQCLDDYSIPLHLSKTITKIIGKDRVEAVQVSDVDKNMNPIKGTEQFIQCDGVILSVGLIPENEIAEKLGVNIDKATKGPIVDQNFMTNVEGVFSCGNALHVNDLVDYVSESGKYAGENAALYCTSREKNKNLFIDLNESDFLYAVPQKINLECKNTKITMYFRSRNTKRNVTVTLRCKDKIIFKKRYSILKPPEMKKIEFDIKSLYLDGDLNIRLLMNDL